MARADWLTAAFVALLSIGCGGASLSGPADGGQCHDLFNPTANGTSPVVACCPDPRPDCSNQADGYPGYACVERSNQFCSCSCQEHVWTCGC
jgi:hypothetical protein